MTSRIVGLVFSVRMIRLAAEAGTVLALVAALAAPAEPQEPGAYFGAIRWPDRTSNDVRVWIQSASSVADWTATNIDAARDAFASWSALKLGVPFTFVADSATAEIRVRWVDRFGVAISGHTVADHDASHWIVGATVELAVHHLDGRTLDRDALRSLALHEVGHALGLEHSSDDSTVMAPTVRVRGLTAADRAAAKRLYGIRDSTPSAPRPPR